MVQHNHTLSELDLVRSICEDDFYSFVQEFWSVVVPEDPVWNWHVPYLCQELQTGAERVFQHWCYKCDRDLPHRTYDPLAPQCPCGSRRIGQGRPKLHDLIINISPGTTKSTICSVMFPMWVWTRMPSARSICASYSYPLAMNLSRLSRDIVQADQRAPQYPGGPPRPGFATLWPQATLRPDQSAKGHFANHRGGMRYATSVGGTVTGMHGHFLIVDDPLDPQAALSMAEADLNTANEWMSQTLPSRKVNKEVSWTALIMQRLHQNDPTGNWIAQAQSRAQQTQALEAVLASQG